MYLYSTFLVVMTTQGAFTLHVSFTHSHTDGQPAAHHEETNRSYAFVGAAMGAILGISVLPKDTSTCGLEE